MTRLITYLKCYYY